MSFNFIKGVLQLVCLQFFLIATPATAASQLFINLGPAEFTLEVEDLKTFSATGKAPPLLKRMLKDLSPEDAEMVRSLFSTPIKIDPTRLSKFLYTPQGEAMLQELGQVLQSESGLSGFYGLRAALVQSAEESKTGLTVPDVLEKFPSDRIRINQARIFELAKSWSRFDQASQIALAQAAQPAQPDFERFPLSAQLQLQERGKYRWVRAEELKTPAGDVADLYVPQSIRRSEKPFEIGQRPVIVISHGLGGDRTSFVYLAEHFASHGFVVVVPDHPLMASRNASFYKTRGGQPPTLNLNQLFDDEWAKTINARDFSQRPQSVSRLLDELETRTEQDPQLQGKVNPQQVGIIGQSFGGYAALALGGAKIDLDFLGEHCPANATAINLSLVLQCRAQPLSQVNYQDQRVKAVAAINPVGSALFGPKGMGAIDRPVLMLSGTNDVVTPPLPEQFRPFNWLTTDHRYLMLLEGGTHLSLIDNLEEVSLIPSVNDSPNSSQFSSFLPASNKNLSKELKVAQDAWVIGPAPEQAKRYLSATSLAFFQAHLMEQPSYEAFLTPTFAATLSDGKPMQFSLLNKNFLLD